MATVNRNGCVPRRKRQICAARFPAVNPPTDCLRCGACCFSPSDQFVRVTGEDWTRLGEAAGRVAHFVGNRAFMRMSEGHCAALEIRRAGDGGAEYFCTLYDRRPQICRDLARGSAECEGEIAVTSGQRRVSGGSAGVPPA